MSANCGRRDQFQPGDFSGKHELNADNRGQAKLQLIQKNLTFWSGCWRWRGHMEQRDLSQVYPR